jgi:hypothetical protein
VARVPLLYDLGLRFATTSGRAVILVVELQLAAIVA